MMPRAVAFTSAILGLFLLGSLAPAAAFDQRSLVSQKCAGCHKLGVNGISAVEEIRTTVEEWAVIVDRMARLWDMPLDAGDMDRLLKELTATQSLSPDDQRQVAYLSLQHNSQQMEVPEGEAEQLLFTACVRCHSAGKIYSYRMTPERWKKLKTFHAYMTPTIYFQLREMRWGEVADKVLTGLGTSHPYGQAWTAPDTSAAGRWIIVGREAGRGEYRGEATLTAKGDGDFAMQGSREFRDGKREDFMGDATLYGGYALRTRTRHGGSETYGAYILDKDEVTGEMHYPAPRFRTAQERWVPASSGARILGISPSYLVKGRETTVRIQGIDLPDGALSSDNSALTVKQQRRLDRDLIEVVLLNEADTYGVASLRVGSLEAGKITLAPRVDYLKVVPETGRARLAGGAHVPPESVQFEAIAYSNGASASDAADDVALGPVPAQFTLQEAATRPGDDDLKWAGSIESNGYYVPPGDYAPIPQREYGQEASGWVAVKATYEDLAAEAKLAVTVPDFVKRIR
jgi:quinohemoprotein amine dehydrogenase